jgi:putative FmdB family regulatory protein
MPVFEYECRKCGEKFEVRRGFWDKETGTKCPKCGSDDVKKVFSLFGMGSSGGSCSPTPRRFG